MTGVVSFLANYCTRTGCDATACAECQSPRTESAALLCSVSSTRTSRLRLASDNHCRTSPARLPARQRPGNEKGSRWPTWPSSFPCCVSGRPLRQDEGGTFPPHLAQSFYAASLPPSTWTLRHCHRVVCKEQHSYYTTFYLLSQFHPCRH